VVEPVLRGVDAASRGTQRRARSAFWLALLAVALVAIALRARVADLPFERDEGEYAYVAWRWLAGDVPYRDAFDQKPPGIFAFYAAAFAVGGESPAAVRWAAQIWLLGALACVAALGARLANPAAGVAAAIAGVALTSDPSWLGNAINTEQIATLPLALGAWLAWTADGARLATARAAALGLCAAGAILLKPVTAPIVAFEIATALVRSRARGAASLGIATGGALALGATLGWFAAHGALAALLDAVVWNNLDYAGATPLAQYPVYFAAQFRPTLGPLGPLYGAALLAPLALRTRTIGAARLAWIAAWLAASLLAVSAGGYFRQHYFALAMPPLALLAGIGLDALVRTILGARFVARLAAPFAAAVLLGWSVAVGWWYYGPATPAAKLHRIYGSNPFPEAPALGAWLASRAADDDRIFVYGSEPQLLFYAQRPSASRYIFVYPLMMPLPASAARQRETLAELDAAPPRFVVGVFVRTSTLEQPGTPPELERGLRERIERDYEVAAVVPFAKDRDAKILEGKPARAMWNDRPLWDGATPWAAFVVWELRREDE
jgi:hypothetical protein